MQRIFIGGCGSSGTTLMAQILNSHPEIYCGPEASIFDRDIELTGPAQPIIDHMKLDNYRKFDQRMPFPIMLMGDVSHSQIAISSWRWQEVFPNNNREKIIQAYDGVDSFKASDLFNTLFYNERLAADKMSWAEKSPGNIFFFPKILEAYPDAQFIIMVRNPWDTIYSLICNRNFSQHEAVCRFTASLQATLRWYQTHDAALFARAYIVSYDRLINPEHGEEELQGMWDFLGYPKTSVGWDAVDKDKPSTFQMYVDRILPSVRELVYHSCESQWQKFCDLNPRFERGIVVE
jgi:hypothetical protein